MKFKKKTIKESKRKRWGKQKEKRTQSPTKCGWSLQKKYRQRDFAALLLATLVGYIKNTRNSTKEQIQIALSCVSEPDLKITGISIVSKEISGLVKPIIDTRIPSLMCFALSFFPKDKAVEENARFIIICHFTYDNMSCAFKKWLTC